jgi:hypothetical protein
MYKILGKMGSVVSLFCPWTPIDIEHFPHKESPPHLPLQKKFDSMGDWEPQGLDLIKNSFFN